MKTFLFGALFIFPLSLSSQIKSSSKFINLSFINQKVGFVDLELNYQYRSVNLEYSQYNALVYKPNYSIVWDLNPQFGITSVKEDRNLENGRSGIEVAFLFGLAIEISMIPKSWRLYLGGAIGPQYISQAPMRQKTGFLFSDNLFIGSKLKLSKQIFDLRIGFRHQSNASIGEPNGGINSFFIKGGFPLNN